ncbi:hypothetical protein [Erwinia sp. 198]|uniref:hypothetical protein n=1 Tax=Erwinia sp. 198 TaxID=2022746 RepID=UPI000F692A12|nr:hypothetical protein [Erwinia sp. 198]
MGYALRDAPLNNADREPGLPALRSSGGDGGGGMTENIEPRVRKLENDVAVISHNLAVLTVRSESFATHADVANIRTEMATMRGELKEEMASLRGELKGDIVSLRGELKGDIVSLRGELKSDIVSLRGEIHETLQKAINKQTVLLLTIIPATLAAIAAVAAWFK